MFVWTPRFRLKSALPWLQAGPTATAATNKPTIKTVKMTFFMRPSFSGMLARSDRAHIR